MKLILDDLQTFEIELHQNPVSSLILQIFKHLQHVPIPFRDWDNPFFLSATTHQQLVQGLEFFAQRLQIKIDLARCQCQDQSYFNDLHRIYEQSYDGDPQWLDFHEHIHLCEKHDIDHNARKLSIDYREKAGLLERRFDHSVRDFFKTKVSPGEVYVSWAELGKIPYHYWQNNESDNLDRICQLAKPWLVFRPKLIISFSEIDFLKDKKISEFNEWWQRYHDGWCAHWKIDHWDIKDMFGISSVGHIQDLPWLQHCLEKGNSPRWIKL